MIYPYKAFAIEHMSWKDGDQEPTEQEILAAIETHKIAKTTAKQAILDKLGITADEAALLLGQRDACTCLDRVRNNTNKRTIKSTQQCAYPMRHNYTMRKGI